MEQELINQVKSMLPKINDSRSLFSEKEGVPIKAMFEEITKTRIHKMTACGGKLCEDIRKTIINFFKVYTEPVKEIEPIIPKVPILEKRNKKNKRK